jgi:hypothetical protein
VKVTERSDAGKPVNGGVQAIATAASGVLTIGIAFLGYWAFGPRSGLEPWQFGDLFVVSFAIFGFAFLLPVPYLATRAETQANLNAARNAYQLGALLVFLAVSTAVSLSVLR